MCHVVGSVAGAAARVQNIRGGIESGMAFGVRPGIPPLLLGSLLVLASSCTTVPEIVPEQVHPWRVEQYAVAPATDRDSAVAVTALTIDLAAVRPVVVVDGEPVGPAGDEVPIVTLGVTPWGWSRGTLRETRHPMPVGVVRVDDDQRAPPVPPYWALILYEDGLWRIAPQESLPPPGTADDIRVALGAFYPLVIDGRPVAAEFPGSTLRAARVAIGWRPGPGEHRSGAGELVVVAAEGSRIGGGPGRAGLTTPELAAVLQRYGVRWALNLDGGRSAYLAITPGGDEVAPVVLPARVPLRRPGPVRLDLRCAGTTGEAERLSQPLGNLFSLSRR